MSQLIVIPAKAETQHNKGRREATVMFAPVWAPACAGVTGGEAP